MVTSGRDGAAERLGLDVALDCPAAPLPTAACAAESPPDGTNVRTTLHPRPTIKVSARRTVMVALATLERDAPRL